MSKKNKEEEKDKTKETFHPTQPEFSDMLTSDKGVRRSTLTNTAVIPAVCLILSAGKHQVIHM